MASKIIFNDLPEISERLWVDDIKSFEDKLSQTSDRLLIEAAVSMREKGYVIVNNAITSSLCDEAIESFNSWCEENKDVEYEKKRGKRKRVVSLHSNSTPHKKLITQSEKLLKILDYLFSYPVSVYSSISFQYGTEQALHIDTPVFSTSPREFYFGVWVALEEANEENGCLRALPGAHLKKYVDEFEFYDRQPNQEGTIDPSAKGLWSAFQNELVEKATADGFTPESIPVQKGDVIIWHPQLPHGGSEIKSPNKTRYSTVFHVAPEGVPVYQADVFFDSNKAKISNEAAYIYEKEDGRLFRIGVGAHFGGN